MGWEKRVLKQNKYEWQPRKQVYFFILPGLQSLWLFLDLISYNFLPNFIFTEKTVGSEEEQYISMIYHVSVIYKHLERPILQSQGYLIETLSWLFTKSQTDTSPNEIHLQLTDQSTFIEIEQTCKHKILHAELKTEKNSEWIMLTLMRPIKDY